MFVDSISTGPVTMASSFYARGNPAPMPVSPVGYPVGAPAAQQIYPPFAGQTGGQSFRPALQPALAGQQPASYPTGIPMHDPMMSDISSGVGLAPSYSLSDVLNASQQQGTHGSNPFAGQQPLSAQPLQQTTGSGSLPTFTQPRSF
jgi:hypothetical protein